MNTTEKAANTLEQLRPKVQSAVSDAASGPLLVSISDGLMGIRTAHTAHLVERTALLWQLLPMLKLSNQKQADKVARFIMMDADAAWSDRWKAARVFLHLA